MASSPENVAKNMEAIHKAIVQHNGNCEGRIIEIQMNPHEVERFGDDTFLEIPVVGNYDLPTGRFRLVCDRENPEDQQKKTVEAVGTVVETGEEVVISAPQ